MATKEKKEPVFEQPVADEAVTANKRDHGREITWTMKKGSTVPDRWHEHKVQILLAKAGATPEESMANMLAFATSHEAVVDAFNAQHRLDVQKGMKDAVLRFKEGTDTDAQVFADTALSVPAQKGKGEGAKSSVTIKKARETAKAATAVAEELIAQLPPEQQEAYRQKLAALSL